MRLGRLCAHLLRRRPVRPPSGIWHLLGHALRALSIYGSEIIPNGAGPDGNGYGDGRAISIAEVALPPPLAFRRRCCHYIAADAANAADGVAPGDTAQGCRQDALLPQRRRPRGAALLDAEFLASEAMHALGVPTTRALCLVASRVERASRPWYRNLSSAIALGMVTTPQRHGGDVMREERCAITTRVARSFVRVGQIELYGRRARRGDPLGFAQLERLVRHVARREYPNETAADALQGEGGDGGGRLGALVLAIAAAAARRVATHAAEWVRVGYVQSNFNSDNCLVGGATVDYGPWLPRALRSWVGDVDRRRAALLLPESAQGRRRTAPAAPQPRTAARRRRW